MPKYKVGDVAALFPKPSAPSSDTGTKIQSMFDDFYKNSKKKNKANHALFNQRKKERNQAENSSESPNEAKKNKRKHLEDTSVSNSQDIAHTQIKQKKIKLDNVDTNLNGKVAQTQENYFPRNKTKSKNFKSMKGNSAAFPKMSFDEGEDDGEDESFSHFDSKNQKMSNQKKYQNKKFSENETAENNDSEMLKSKSSKKMKKISNSKNQNEEFSFNESSTFEEPEEEEQSLKKKSKKKKNKKPKKDNVVVNESDEEERLSASEDMEDQSDEEEPKINLKKNKKKKKALSFENDLNNDSAAEEESDEESSKVTPSKKKTLKKPVETAERLARTLFVGNLPVAVTRQRLQKLFSRFGSIETCRIRGSVPVKSTIPKKVAAIKSQFHAGQKSCIGYVVFKDANDAVEALSMNGTQVGDHHIVVNLASSVGEKKTYDEKLSIFIGNLPFDVEDEAIWSAFASCGEVEAVRVIRDQETGAGRGFGYVLFKNVDSKEAALKKEDIEISDRKIRVKTIDSKAKKSATPNHNNKLNALRRKVKKMKGKPDGPNSRKSLKKLMNRERRNHQKKKIASIFKKLSK